MHNVRLRPLRQLCKYYIYPYNHDLHLQNLLYSFNSADLATSVVGSHLEIGFSNASSAIQPRRYGVIGDQILSCANGLEIVLFLFLTFSLSTYNTYTQMSSLLTTATKRLSNLTSQIRNASTTTMKEAVVSKGPKVTIRDVPIPKPGANQVVTKVIFSGSNPKDWKGPGTPTQMTLD